MIEVSFRPIGKSPVAVGFGVFWIDPDCSIKTLNGLVILGSGDVGHPAIVMSLGVVSLFQQGKISTVDGFQVFTLLVIGCGPVGKSVGTICKVDGITALIFQGASKFLDGVVIFSLAVQSDTAKHDGRPLGRLGL